MGGASTSATNAARRAKHLISCPALRENIRACPVGQNTFSDTAVSPEDEGRYGQSSRNVGRDAMDAKARRRCVLTRTVKPRGPDSPTLESSEWSAIRPSAETSAFATGANKPGTPGRARSKP